MFIYCQRPLHLFPVILVYFVFLFGPRCSFALQSKLNDCPVLFQEHPPVSTTSATLSSSSSSSSSALTSKPSSVHIDGGQPVNGSSLPQAQSQSPSLSRYVAAVLVDHGRLGVTLLYPCVGTFVSVDIILTQARCIYDRSTLFSESIHNNTSNKTIPVRKIYVYPGLTNVKPILQNQTLDPLTLGQERSRRVVRQAFVNPYYRPTGARALLFDIAWLQLNPIVSSDVNITNSTTTNVNVTTAGDYPPLPTPLPMSVSIKPYFPNMGQVLRTAGFLKQVEYANDSFGESLPPSIFEAAELLQVDLPAADFQRCVDTYGQFVSTDFHACMGYRQRKCGPWYGIDMNPFFR